MEPLHPSSFGLFRRTLIIAVTAVAVVSLSLFLWAIAQVLLLLFAGLLLAVFLHGSAQSASRWTGLSPRMSLALLLTGVLAVAATILLFLVPKIQDEAQGFREQLPRAIDHLQEFVSRKLPDGAPQPDDFSATDLIGAPSDLIQRFTGILSSAVGVIGSAAVIFFVGLFLAISPRTYRSGLVTLFPPNRRPRVSQILDRLGDRLWWWIVAKLGSMTVVGILTGIGLYFLDVPLLFSLVLFAALMTFIPNVGPVIAAVPAVLLGLLRSPEQALWIALMYVGVQTVESYLVTPMFQQRAISLAPALVISAQLAMGVLAGAVGLLVATPLTAAIVVLVRELYLRDVLHEPLDDSD